ncbi:hypothetical protein R3P38DRAFT_2951847 [Favolaschia claudopus]|uniref:Uncharacterized protein n=1 Tax=Favolaschia claudopus TaxID=2862362 RepID=A0AAW0BFT1_9AGAR
MDSSNEDAFLRIQVWGMFLGSLTFGVYLVTCGACYSALFFPAARHRGTNEINWPLLFLFFVFFAKATSSVGVHLYLNLQTVTTADLDAAARLFRDGSRPINTWKYITHLLESVIASAFFIYRCWLIHYRSWLVVAPSIVFWLAAVALMGVVIHVDTSLNINGFFAMSQSRVFGSCFWAIIIAVNVVTTGQIAYRIYRVGALATVRPAAQIRSTDTMSSPPLKNSSEGVVPYHATKFATHLVIESGMIYTGMSLLVFFLFVANSNVVYTAINVLVQSIGISFNLVVIHNRPRSNHHPSFLAELNSVPLQFTSSNLSVPASAIEFAYPKHFTPRRKNPVPPADIEIAHTKEDISQSSLAPSIAAIPQNNYSRQSIH